MSALHIFFQWQLPHSLAVRVCDCHKQSGSSSTYPSCSTALLHPCLYPIIHPAHFCQALTNHCHQTDSVPCHPSPPTHPPPSQPAMASPIPLASAPCLHRGCSSNPSPACLQTGSALSCSHIFAHASYIIWRWRGGKPLYFSFSKSSLTRPSSNATTAVKPSWPLTRL